MQVSLLNLPAAFWIASFLSDLGYMVRASSSTAALSFYLMAMGIVASLICMLVEMRASRTLPKGSGLRKIGNAHLCLSIVVTTLYVLNFFARYGVTGSIPHWIGRGAFLVSFVSILLVSLIIYLGSVLALRVRLERKNQEGGSEETHPRAA